MIPDNLAVVLKLEELWLQLPQAGQPHSEGCKLVARPYLGRALWIYPAKQVFGLTLSATAPNLMYPSQIPFRATFPFTKLADHLHVAYNYGKVPYELSMTSQLHYVPKPLFSGQVG